MVDFVLKLYQIWCANETENINGDENIANKVLNKIEKQNFYKMGNRHKQSYSPLSHVTLLLASWFTQRKLLCSN